MGCAGEPGPHVGHILTVGQYGSGGDKLSSDARMNRLYAYLSANRVKLSMRRGVLRFSLHVYNNLDDVNRTLELTAKALAH